MCAEKTINSIYDLNKEYLELVNSDEFKLARNIKIIKKMLKSKHFFQVLSLLKLKFKNLLIRRYSRPNNISALPDIQSFNVQRIAVYTVIFGKYDQIYEPIIVDPLCDYYIITDQEISLESVWTKIDVNKNEDIQDLDNLRKNRYYKMNPFTLFPTYNYSIYLDGNVHVYGNISKLVCRISAKTGVGLHVHSSRNCLYAESKCCILLKKGKKNLIKKQMSTYRRRSFPENYGLFECNIIARKHSKECKKLMEAWWQEFSANGSLRDQLSFPYILWENGYSSADIGILGANVRLNPLFRIRDHQVE